MTIFVKAFADKLGLTHFAIGGNSMGGGVAARFAEEYPDRVTHLILVDAHAEGMASIGDRIPLPLGWRGCQWQIDCFCSHAAFAGGGRSGRCHRPQIGADGRDDRPILGLCAHGGNAPGNAYSLSIGARYLCARPCRRHQGADADPLGKRRSSRSRWQPHTIGRGRSKARNW